MTKIPDSLLSVPAMLLHIIGLPVFFLSFVLLYQSQWMIDFLSMGIGDNRLVFNALMLMCILIGVLCASRIPMTACRQWLRLTWLQYVLWSAAELIVAACFMALYMALMYGDYGYFPALGQCLIIAVATLSYPYVMLNAIFCAAKPDQAEAAEENLIRFADSTGRLKLVIADDVLLYIEAQENYVNIHYMEGERTREYSLRQSMRNIETLMEKHGIVRCQRSYFVNPRHVTVLRRDKEGIIQAELDINGSRSVPVSPKYYEQLNKLL